MDRINRAEKSKPIEQEPTIDIVVSLPDVLNSGEIVLNQEYDLTVEIDSTKITKDIIPTLEMHYFSVIISNDDDSIKVISSEDTQILPEFGRKVSATLKIKVTDFSTQVITVMVFYANRIVVQHDLPIKVVNAR